MKRRSGGSFLSFLSGNAADRALPPPEKKPGASGRYAQRLDETSMAEESFVKQLLGQDEPVNQPVICRRSAEVQTIEAT